MWQPLQNISIICWLWDATALPPPASLFRTFPPHNSSRRSIGREQKAILLSEAATRAAATTSTLTFKTIFNAVKITVKMAGKELKRPEGKQITTKRTAGALTICTPWHTIHTPAYLMPVATTRTQETGTAYSPGPLALLPLQPSSSCHPQT